jgi:subtilisin family serine protease
MQRSIVLRDLNRTRLADSFGSGTREIGAKGLGLSAPEPRIDVETVDHKGRAELVRDPEVTAICPAMPTRLIEPLGTREPNETDAAWGISAVGATNCQFTGDGVVVAVLDTGIDGSHAAFEGMTLVEEDFSESGSGDRQGHGTHCAGTIFGRDLDGERIGVAPGVSRGLIGKVLADNGTGGSEMAFRGIRWAVEQGAQVVSMSLGFDFPGLVKALTDDNWPVDLATSNALEAYRGNLRMFDALMNMVQATEGFGAGTVVVAAAGNESRRDENPDYEIAASLPAAAEGVLSVGAVGQGPAGLQIGYFSNTFPQICAPGVNVKSAKTGGGTTVMSGTSMACPHVAGVAALWWEAVHDAGLPVRAQTVLAKLLASARTDQLGIEVDTVDRGVGLVAAP